MTEEEQRELEAYFKERTGRARNLNDLGLRREALKKSVENIRNFKSEDYGKLFSFSATAAAASASAVTLGLTGASLSVNGVSVKVRIVYGSVEGWESTGAGMDLDFDANAGATGFATNLVASAFYPFWLAFQGITALRNRNVAVAERAGSLQMDDPY